MRSHALGALVALLLLTAGCLSPMDSDAPPSNPTPGMVEPTPATFRTSTIDVALHQGHGLYEPTIDVGPDGQIYVSAHSTLVGVFPAPGYVSTDDAQSWQQMALAGPLVSPAPGQLAGTPLSDEIFIVAGDDGQSWGVDINLHSFLLNGWCSDGAEHCYANPQAYDHIQTVAQAADCAPVPLKDRPWAAYNNGWLFIVNNPGGGPAQIASMQVPPTTYPDVGHVVNDIQWNLCASSGGFIPGIPDLRADGFFALAQLDGPGYKVVTGQVEDVLSTTETYVFDNTHIAPAESDSTPSQIGLYGQASFDGRGTLFVGAMNNSRDLGGLHFAFSTDDGATFQEATFRFEGMVSTMYMDGYRQGEGVLVNWGQIDGANTDYYMGHLKVRDGELVLENVMLAFDDGPEASRHVQGAAVGPDGRAYMVMSDVSGNDDVAMVQAIGTMPLRVVVQESGPTL